LLKFTGELVTLVLIRGSNLDVLVGGSVNLTHGLQRHRILGVREMDEEELRETGEKGRRRDTSAHLAYPIVRQRTQTPLCCL
jgi:hypothetical protein